MVSQNGLIAVSKYNLHQVSITSTLLIKLNSWNQADRIYDYLLNKPLIHKLITCMLLFQKFKFSCNP